MKNSFDKLFTALLTAFVMTSIAWAPAAEARPGGPGGHVGGGGGGGGARAHAGGGGAQINNRNADVRTNNVRSSSVNSVNASRNTNINANKNVNVNVNASGGCCGRGWDNDYHPVATAAAVGATVAVTSAVVGSMVRAVPTGCVPVNYGGIVYQQCGTVWYQPQGAQFVVVNAPY